MILVQSHYCPQNHRCPTLRVCPTGALQQTGYSAPTIDAETCIECGRCVQSCRVFKEVSGVAGGSQDSPAPQKNQSNPLRIIDRLKRF